MSRECAQGGLRYQQYNAATTDRSWLRCRCIDQDCNWSTRRIRQECIGLTVARTNITRMHSAKDAIRSRHFTTENTKPHQARNTPAVHDVHTVEPALELNVPGAQLTHTVAFAPLMVPTSHWVHDDEPLFEYVPAAQPEQAAEPEELLYNPAGHGAPDNQRHRPQSMEVLNTNAALCGAIRQFQDAPLRDQATRTWNSAARAVLPTAARHARRQSGGAGIRARQACRARRQSTRSSDCARGTRRARATAGRRRVLA